MQSESLEERITRSLAYMLRHQPDEFDLELDREGWGDLDEVVQALQERLGDPIDAVDVQEAIAAGDRPRYEIRGERIRALYGHSFPIDPGAPSEPPELLYLGVGSRDAMRAETHGLRGGRRAFLHLARTYEDALDAGRRAARDYAVITVFALDAYEDGIDFYDRGALFLAEELPTEFLEVGELLHDGVERRGPRTDDARGRGRERDGRRGESRGGNRDRGRDDDRPRREHDRPRRDEPRRDGPRRDEARRDEPRRDEPRREEGRREEGRREEGRREEPRRDVPRRGEPRREDPRREEPRRDDTRREESRREEPRREESRREDSRREEAGSDEPRRDEARRDEPRREGSRRDEPRRDEARRDEARRDEALRDEPRRGAPPETERDVPRPPAPPKREGFGLGIFEAPASDAPGGSRSRAPRAPEPAPKAAAPKRPSELVADEEETAAESPAPRRPSEGSASGGFGTGIL